MALVMMSMQFILETRIDNIDMHPLLSCYDIQILIATAMPDRRDESDETIRQLHERTNDTASVRHQSTRQSRMRSKWRAHEPLFNMAKWN